MTILATCATLAALVASAPSEPVRIRDNCGELVLKAPSTVTVEAEASTVRGLRLKGNVRWKGGTLSAPDGLDGFAARGYAVSIAGEGNALFSATVRDAKKGIVIAKATRTTIGYTDFVGLREDGIIASEAKGLSLYWLRFAGSQPKPTQCAVAGKINYSVPKRDCEALAGAWTDGNHADAIQMRNGVTDATISNVTISGQTQGITQMDTTGDAPLARVVVRDSVIQTSEYHQITLGECINCRIERNVVLRTPGSERKAVIRPGEAARCGNEVPDEKMSDQPC